MVLSNIVMFRLEKLRILLKVSSAIPKSSNRLTSVVLSEIIGEMFPIKHELKLNLKRYLTRLN